MPERIILAVIGIRIWYGRATRQPDRSGPAALAVALRKFAPGTGGKRHDAA